jgi:O-antigen/teichoic acid export membrane protein
LKTNEFLATSSKGGLVVAIATLSQLGIRLISQIALARILAPEIFGEIAFASTIAMLFNSMSNLRGDAYIVYHKRSNKDAIDVVFTLELLSALFFASLLIFSSKILLTLFQKEEMVLYVQIFALALFYNPFSRTRSLLEKELAFVKSKLPAIMSQLLSSVLSIVLALNGYGIWSLLVWRISVLLFEVIGLLIVTPYYPKFKFILDLKIVLEYLKYSYPLVLSGLLSYIHYNVDYFIIGQYLDDGKLQLGYYWLGFQAASYVLLFRQVLYQVLFPIFSRLDDAEFKNMIFIKLTDAVASVFTLLVVVGIIMAPNLISFAYGESWTPAVFPFRIILIVIMMRAVNSNMGYLFHSSGNTKLDLSSVAISTVQIIPSAYYATISYGINGTAIAVLVVQMIVNIIMYERYVKPMVGLGVLRFFKWPWMLTFSALGISLYSTYLNLNIFINIMTCIVYAVIIYSIMLKGVISNIKKAISKI